MNDLIHLNHTVKGMPVQLTASDLALLARCGLELIQPKEQNQGYFLLRGNTLPYDAILKNAGARWGRMGEAWLLKNIQTLRSFLSAISTMKDPCYAGLNESRTEFDNERTAPSLVSRLLEAGPNAISNEELLTLILMFDHYISAPEEVSKALLAEFGTLGSVLNATPSRLTKFVELSPRTAGLIGAIQLMLERVLHEPIQRHPVIGSWQALLDYLNIRLKNIRKERLIVLYLDRKNRLIKEDSVEGTVDHVPLYPREITLRALELFSKSLIVVHNHPSGDPSPSKSDIETTRQLQNALSPLDIILHDHLIVGRDGHFSFKTESLI